MALANAFSSKVEYCAQFGVTITEEMWPSVGIPSSILADRGELLSRQAEILWPIALEYRSATHELTGGR